MQKKALFLDLDNTIYLVSSIGEELFKSLFQIISESGEFSENIEELKKEIMRRPFQFVANDFSFSDSLRSKCMDHLLNLTYETHINTFEGYPVLQEIPCKKFLVTTGFTKLQNSKIDRLNIRDDFEKIYIIDPSLTSLSKRDVFKKILVKYKFKIDEVLVVGDDLNSEIKAAQSLGIDSVLYDYQGNQTANNGQKVIRNFAEVKNYI